MELKRAAGHHRRDRPFDRLRRDLRLFRAGDQHHHAGGVENGADPHGEGPLRHRLGRIEIDTVLLIGFRREGFRPGTAAERGDRLVESDMSVVTDAEQLKVDASRIADRLLVAAPLGELVLRQSVRQVRVPDVDVDFAEQMTVHVITVGVRVIRRQPDVFIEIERVGLRKIHLFCPVHLRKLGINGLHRGSGRQSEFEKRLLFDGGGDQPGSQPHGLFRCGANDHFHGESHLLLK
ncbi:hypothetical protein SDC9_163245 [bioreactor metagenome]|uniref:Uncharacterized protein n=1 Tax=bioreactor metagenome TaxID=1076179 RepID=A0A645FR75_9ZZZZ